MAYLTMTSRSDFERNKSIRRLSTVTIVTLVIFSAYCNVSIAQPYNLAHLINAREQGTEEQAFVYLDKLFYDFRAFSQSQLSIEYLAGNIFIEPFGDIFNPGLRFTLLRLDVNAAASEGPERIDFSFDYNVSIVGGPDSSDLIEDASMRLTGFEVTEGAAIRILEHINNDELSVMANALQKTLFSDIRFDEPTHMLFVSTVVDLAARTGTTGSASLMTYE